MAAFFCLEAYKLEHIRFDESDGPYGRWKILTGCADILLSTNEAAAELMITPQNLRLWKSKGTGPKTSPLPTGKRQGYKVSNIVSYMNLLRDRLDSIEAEIRKELEELEGIDIAGPLPMHVRVLSNEVEAIHELFKSKTVKLYKRWKDFSKIGWLHEIHIYQPIYKEKRITRGYIGDKRQSRLVWHREDATTMN